ncbi:hypothetical protein MUO32_14630 [Shinella sp. CPCC 101442]|uniref:hypothetical protein n=1 Tax=Shinella sp. CPCC 101442 TaxID=2932265 RepID=UPI00215229A6|nr:hypothetical protein [Shinella sp. CPCC 101442]MCR6500283.1 hypothetical protein [Shinella sp. CPCC 101442]
MRYFPIFLFALLAGCMTPPSPQTIADNAYCTRLYGAISDYKTQCLYERSIGNNDPRDPFSRRKQ